MELLPVVDEACRLIGVLRRGDLLAHYSDKVLAQREEVVAVRAGTGRIGEEVGLGKGLILERVVVGRAWAGRSLAELALRNTTGASVLEWMRGDVTISLEGFAPRGSTAVRVRCADIDPAHLVSASLTTIAAPGLG